ncbi:MAG TPA: class I SAM-dependent methyltransferase [Pyrinomonadaceae bacterium]|jgi:glycosyltransferase involved in cell wall biosynthesis/predicted O-methyltransferase YrrM
MGFMNRDEATLLYNIALQFTGKPALEIGGWLGWSTCHMALAGVRLDVVDPAYADPSFKAIVERSLAGCGVTANVNLTSVRSPEGVHELAAGIKGRWSLFVIDGDHEGAAPVRDVEACLPYASPDCAFVFHDLASPMVAAGLRSLHDAGFNVLVYQTQQIMGLAWRGKVTPVAHVPDPDVAWQLPHHLIGLPVSGIELDTHSYAPSPSLINSSRPFESDSVATGKDFSLSNGQGAAAPRLLRDVYEGRAAGAQPSVCIVSNEIIGPFKNGGIGTSMTGLAEHLAASGCAVTILYTGGVWAPDIPLARWKKRYARLGIDFVALSIAEMKSLHGPVKDCGFGVPYLVFQYLDAKQFDVVHFNDCTGEGSLCLAAKKLGLAFEQTLLVVALHSPSQWVLELNHRMPASLLLSVYNYAEHLSIKCADVLWSPSKYLTEWATQRGFELPDETFIQQYCLPSQRLREQDEGPSAFPAVSYGRAAPPKEIVFFGRLEERKGLRLFCNAIHTLRQELAARNITVTFLGKAETCGGMGSLEYIALRSKEWQFPVKTLTNLGQPEGLDYLLQGEKLAVVASPADNSPCTVYEALAWGIPLLAARTGGIPELIDESHRAQVLFECTTEALCASLIGALDTGGWVAAPSQSQEQIRSVWSAFHSDFRRYLKPRKTEERESRAVAIVDGRSQTEILETLESLAAAGAFHHVIVLNRSNESLPPTTVPFSIRNIDLSVEEPEALDEEIAKLGEEAVLMIHSGIIIRGDSFAAMLTTLSNSDVDGLQPAAIVRGERARTIVLPLGGDPSFTLFEGATFTGGLLVRGAALKRAGMWREPAVESAFMGLADFCVTRGIEIWPYPRPVLEQPENWSMNTARPIPTRVKAFDDCSPADRYYMLAAGYGAAPHGSVANVRPGGRRGMAMAMIDMGLLPLVRFAAGVHRRVRGGGPRVRSSNPIQRFLGRLLQGNG